MIVWSNANCNKQATSLTEELREIFAQKVIVANMDILDLHMWHFLLGSDNRAI